jgi:hypothetical protein
MRRPRNLAAANLTASSLRSREAALRDAVRSVLERFSGGGRVG